jgi:hypothetical protein
MNFNEKQLNLIEIEKKNKELFENYGIGEDKLIFILTTLKTLINPITGEKVFKCLIQELQFFFDEQGKSKQLIQIPKKTLLTSLALSTSYGKQATPPFYQAEIVKHLLYYQWRSADIKSAKLKTLKPKNLYKTQKKNWTDFARKSYKESEDYILTWDFEQISARITIKILETVFPFHTNDFFYFFNKQKEQNPAQIKNLIENILNQLEHENTNNFS